MAIVVAVWGGSSAPTGRRGLAFTAADRIKGAVFHGGNVHYGFHYASGWCRRSPPRGSTVSVRRTEPARRSRTGHGRDDDRGISWEVAPALSLKTMGLLDKKSAPLLGVNGKLDDQVPIADVYLLLEHGNPKSARVYPERPPHGPRARPASRKATEIAQHHRRLAEGAVGALAATTACPSSAWRASPARRWPVSTVFGSG